MLSTGFEPSDLFTCTLHKCTMLKIRCIERQAAGKKAPGYAQSKTGGRWAHDEKIRYGLCLKCGQGRQIARELKRQKRNGGGNGKDQIHQA